MKRTPVTSHLPVPRHAEGEVVPEDGTEFFGDSDRLLKRIQEETHRDFVARLYQAARERLRAAALLVGVSTELVRRAERDGAADTANLRRAYRRIAAYFRFICHTGPQLPLPFDDTAQDEHLRQAWDLFFRREAAALLRDGQLARALLAAVVFAGRPEGKAGTSRLLDLLEVRYGRFTLQRRFEILGQDHQDLDGWRFTDPPDWLAILAAVPH